MAFATGIAAWFGLPSQGYWIGLCTVCTALALAAVKLRPRTGEYPYFFQALLVLPLLVATGCLAVWTRSEIVGEQPIGRPIAGMFTGRILDIQPQPAQQRDRLIVSMREPETARAIKARLNAPLPVAEGLEAGALIRFKARLMPPAPPMLPGSYDFARTAWFSGLSASGAVTGPVEVVEPAAAGSGTLGNLRRALSVHILSRLGEGQGGTATALVTGDRGAIAEADDQAMRDSGLAHLLSVSGLHVSAVVGAVYLLVVRVLALFPWLALRVRLPVVAAGAGALASVAYTLLSGAEVPTVRSCAGAILILGAMALGREPLSLRLLAVAAFCVLLLWPEAVIGPSFQMSFGAVLALIAVGSAGPVRAFTAPRDEGMLMRMARHVGLLLLTGVAIDLVLMPIGLHHFHRAGIYGALANVLAIPLTTFVVMPLLATALLLDIAGLGWPVWWLADHAIALLIGIAHWFASRPGAVNILPAAGTGPFLLFVAGGLWLGLWSGRIRWLGLPPALAGTLLLATAAPADILVSGDGRHVGLVEAGGKRLFVLREMKEGYARDNLAEQSGMEGEPVPLTEWPGARCNRDFCTLRIDRDARYWDLLISRGRDTVPERALVAACDRADIVIADRWLPRSCRPRWLKADRISLGRTGGLAIYLPERRVETVADREGQHGWWRPAQPFTRKPESKPVVSPSPAGSVDGESTPAAAGLQTRAGGQL